MLHRCLIKCVLLYLILPVRLDIARTKPRLGGKSRWNTEWLMMYCSRPVSNQDLCRTKSLFRNGAGQDTGNKDTSMSSTEEHSELPHAPLHSNEKGSMTFKIFIPVFIKIEVFWGMTQCQLVNNCQHLRTACCLQVFVIIYQSKGTLSQGTWIIK
jgi:hypothetical protein